MRSLSLCMMAIMMMAPVASLSAADAVTGATSPSTTTAADASVSSALSASLSAAPATTSASLSPSAGGVLGEYKIVSCGSNSAFGVNSCDQCFDGGSVKVGSRMTGLFDSWTNTTANILIAYKDEQKTPNMVKFGNSVWTTTPASEAGVWKYSSDIQWSATGTGSRSNFPLSPGTKVRFLEADLGAGYTLDKTDKKNGEMVGILRFPTVAHSIDLATALESPATTHYECVAYKLDAPAVTPATPVTPVTPKPVPPKDITKTETGPETLLLIAAAFFIAFGLMFTLRRRV